MVDVVLIMIVPYLNIIVVFQVSNYLFPLLMENSQLNSMAISNLTLELRAVSVFGYSILPSFS